MLAPCSIVIQQFGSCLARKESLLRSLVLSALLLAILGASCAVDEDHSVGGSFLLEQGISPTTFGDTTIGAGIIASTFTERVLSSFSGGPVLLQAKWNNAEARIFLRFALDTSFDDFENVTLILHENTPIRRFGPPPALTVSTAEDTVEQVSTGVLVQETDSSGTWSFSLDSTIVDRIATPDSGQTAARILFTIDFPDTTSDFIRRFHALASEMSLRPTLKFTFSNDSQDSVLADSSGFAGDRPLTPNAVAANLPLDRARFVLHPESLAQAIDSNLVIARATATLFIDTANAHTELDTTAILRIQGGFQNSSVSLFSPTSSSAIVPKRTRKIEIDVTGLLQRYQVERNRLGSETDSLGLFVDVPTVGNESNGNIRLLAIVPLLDSMNIDLLFSR